MHGETVKKIEVFWIIRAADRGKLDVLVSYTIHITYKEVNVELQALLIFAPASPSGGKKPINPKIRKLGELRMWKKWCWNDQYRIEPLSFRPWPVLAQALWKTWKTRSKYTLWCALIFKCAFCHFHYFV